MTSMLVFVMFVVALAFIFDFINGFHDAANSTAIIVSTGVLKPFTAVLWAAFFNFIAFLFFHLKVAGTMGTGLVDPSVITPYLIFASLTGAIIWNLVTWYFGLPSSSSHALIGGLIGAALIKSGFSVLNYAGIGKVLLAIVLSPVFGMVAGMFLMKIVGELTRNLALSTTTKWFRRLLFVFAAFLSLGHGANDAQKTMGIIAVLLFSTGLIGKSFYVPFWVVISCNLVMALGTLTGGWRIADTLGNKITKLYPKSGCCAEVGAAVTLYLATDLGIPVSTTHTITGAVAGVGISSGFFGGTQWEVVRRIVWAWLLTIPAAGVLSAALMELAKLYHWAL